MSEHDIRALDANFGAWRTERAPDLAEDKAFEIYSVNQTLKDYDLSDEETNSGNLGGENDGGIDAIYLFINGILIHDETSPPVPTSKVEIIFLQATREKGFKEERIEKFTQFARDIFDYSHTPASLTYLNSSARDTIARFREKYESVLKYDPKLLVTFHYACKSTEEPRPKDKVTARSKALEKYVRSQFTDAAFSIHFWTSQKLLAAARKVPKSEVVVPISRYFSTDDGSTVFLVKLRDYAIDVLTDADGDLNTKILAPNVRDYNGVNNDVNTEIRSSLNESASPEDFWWLNNGITILASSCSINGNKATIRSPEVVNGLQTSHEIFGSRHALQKSDIRQLLVRVVIPKDERSRDRIIKATNSQTAVKRLSLLANEGIQFDIEDNLKKYGLFYDRRRGEYKRLKKALSSIVGQNELVQAVEAVALRVPDEARGRPLTYFEQNSNGVFSANYDRDMYASCILIDRQVFRFLKHKDQKLPSDLRRDLRFYVDLSVCCLLAANIDPAIAEISSLAKACVNPISPSVLTESLRDAKSAYRAVGATDKAAKSSRMRNAMLARIKKRIRKRGKA